MTSYAKTILAAMAVASVCGAFATEHVSDLCELLSIPSVSDSKAENDRAIDWMHAFLQKRGVWCAVERWPKDGRKVLYAATKPGLKDPDYTIVTHLDVVAATADQFRPRLEGSRLYARGASDTKTLAYIAARILERLNGKASVGCIFSSNEEVGGPATGHMVSLGYGVPGKMVFVFDCGCSTNKIGVACKGCAYYRITATGRSGHASVPQSCDNPFYKLARAALKIEAEYPFQKPGEWGNVAAVTIVRGGDSQNRIPESAEMTVNVRFVEEGGLEKERELLERLTGLKTELIRGTPAAVSNLDDPEFVRLKNFLEARHPGIPVRTVRGSGANDARYFPQFKKPMVSVGGVRDGGAHSDCEWVDIDTVGPYIDLMCDFILPAAPRVAYVDDFDLSSSSCGFGRKTQARRTVEGHAFSVCGASFSRGFGSHPEGAVAFRSNGRVAAFDACVALDDDSTNAVPYRTAQTAYGGPEAVFKVWADGKVVWKSEPIHPGEKPVAVHVDLSGAEEIILETCGGNVWRDFAAVSADWLDARFTCEAGATLKVADDPDLYAQLGILTPPESKEPRINGADIWGVRPGRPVIFRVATSGERPMKFSAAGLPDGVTIDGKGVLRGIAPKTPGDYDIAVTAENARGKATRTIRLAVGDTIALTPPMGWNSWNTLCYRLTADAAMAAAKALDESGLADHGWAYVNLDDWWQMNNSESSHVKSRKAHYNGREDVIGAPRDANGKILPNRSFPDMKGLADYIHSLGLKAGLYSSPGRITCGKCEGSLGHELQDAQTWAEWGFDYVKYDWCSYFEVFRKETGLDGWRWRKDYGVNTNLAYRESFVKPYRLMGECLRKQPRDIVFSLCQYGMGQVEQWGESVGGNCWRTGDDLRDTWAWLEWSIDGHLDAEYWRCNRPGWWADPDMMIVGKQYSFGFDHPTFLTPNEQYTHVSLWAMVGSPLLIGCDLAAIDCFTKSLLMNDEVIAVSQDRLGKTARRIRHTDAESVWARPVSGGFKAVALVNRSPVARAIRFKFEEIGLDGMCYVKDLWRQKCEGKHVGYYAALVPPHATKLVKTRPVDCEKCE